MIQLIKQEAVKLFSPLLELGEKARMTGLVLKKMGIKEGARAFLVNAPPEAVEVIDPSHLDLAANLTGEFDYIHFFTKSQEEFNDIFPQLKTHLKPTGTLWVSWPKKASKVPTDLDENIIRDFGLLEGLVDVKVCAVDEIWSGLKFVYRTKDR